MQDFSLFSRGIVKKDVTHVACLNVLVKGTTMCIYRKTVILSICAFPVSLYYWKILQSTTGVFNLWKMYPRQRNSFYSISRQNILTITNASFLFKNASFSQSRLIQYSYIIKVWNGLRCTQ